MTHCMVTIIVEAKPPYPLYPYREEGKIEVEMREGETYQELAERVFKERVKMVFESCGEESASLPLVIKILPKIPEEKEESRWEYSWHYLLFVLIFIALVLGPMAFLLL